VDFAGYLQRRPASLQCLRDSHVPREWNSACLSTGHTLRALAQAAACPSTPSMVANGIEILLPALTFGNLRRQFSLRSSDVRRRLASPEQLIVLGGLREVPRFEMPLGLRGIHISLAPPTLYMRRSQAAALMVYRKIRITFMWLRLFIDGSGDRLYSADVSIGACRKVPARTGFGYGCTRSLG